MGEERDGGETRETRDNCAGVRESKCQRRAVRIYVSDINTILSYHL